MGLGERLAQPNYQKGSQEEMWGQDNEAILYNSASAQLPILTLSADALCILI